MDNLFVLFNKPLTSGCVGVEFDLCCLTNGLEPNIIGEFTVSLTNVDLSKFTRVLSDLSLRGELSEVLSLSLSLFPLLSSLYFFLCFLEEEEDPEKFE